ncbi:MAG: hypothetical protein ABI346_03130, partial [Candidatus Baltobacteraceae bacterium]
GIAEDGAEVVVCGPGSAAALDAALELVAPAGTVVMFAPLEAGTRYPLDQAGVYFRDLRLISSYSCGPEDTKEALRLIVAGLVTAERLGASLVRLEEVAEAYRRMAEGGDQKVIVTFPERAQSLTGWGSSDW